MKYVGKLCNCGSNIRYRKNDMCVNCMVENSRYRESQLNAKKITPDELESIYNAGLIGHTNPYDYNKDIGKYCAWQAGFNDK